MASDIHIVVPPTPRVRVAKIKEPSVKVVDPDGGVAEWGRIIGDMNNQADLQAKFVEIESKIESVVVSNITTDLEPFTKAGEYHIVFKHQLRTDRPDTIEIPFILLVQVSPNGDIIQVRSTPGGYIYRVKAYDSESWGEWSERYNYASKDDIEEAKQWAAIGWVL